MAAKILAEVSVGLTQEILEGLMIATEFSGTKPSQYARQAVLERLVREGYLTRPTVRPAKSSLEIKSAPNIPAAAA